MSGFDLAIAQTKAEEGLRLALYKDMRGFESIGYGTNLSAGIDMDEANYLLNHRIGNAALEAKKQVTNFDLLTPPRQAVLIGISYNLGATVFNQFQHFFAFIVSGNYDAAADDLLNTAAAKELPQRYNRYAAQLRVG